MRKSTYRILVFLATLSLGIAISFIWHFSYSRSIKRIANISIQPVSETKYIKFNEELTKPWILKITPCDSKNSITYPSSDWKRKEIISGGVVNSWAICGNLPKYPKIAKDRNISGVVIVEIIIDEIGEVKEAHAKTGNSLLIKSAVDAAYQTRFCPRLLGGLVYKVKGTLIYRFDSDNGTWLQDPDASDNSFKKVKK